MPKLVFKGTNEFSEVKNIINDLFFNYFSNKLMKILDKKYEEIINHYGFFSLIKNAFI